MKVKLINYVFGGMFSQIFVTFEYKHQRFDFYKDLNTSDDWQFLEDEGFERIKKVADLSLLADSCLHDLAKIDLLISL